MRTKDVQTRARALALAATVALSIGTAGPAPAHGPAGHAIAFPGPARFDFEVPAPGSYRLPVIREATDGAVLDARGAPRRLREVMDGKVTVLSFVYTRCADPNGCPLATSVLHRILRASLQDADLARHLKLVTLSFDPEHDTPAVMARYAGPAIRGGATWEFLTTASPREVAPILRGYGQVVEGPDRRSPLPSHLLRVYLIDARGWVRNIYGLDFLDPRLVVADVRTLLLEARERPAVTWLALLAALLLAPSAARAEDPALARALARIASPPLGLPAVPLPAEYRPTAARVALGRKLFFDRRLSRGGTMSCAMCHLPEQGFTSHELARPVGTEGRSLRRNAPTILNVAYLRRLFHDGRETSLETQALAPLLDRSEMANPSLGAVVETIRALPDYRGLFEAAFGAGPSPDRIGAAIASYERTLLLAGSPFDRWRFGGEAGAMTPAALAGFRLFTGKAGCVACHTMAVDHALFTDQRFHDTGVAARRAAPPTPVPVELAAGLVVALSPETLATVGDPEPTDLGRHEVTQDPADLYRIRTPSLRNVALTAPYMHDGSMRTLEEVVRYYDRGGHRHPGLDPRIRPLGLSDAEVAALVAFLESLTGEGVGELIEEARAPQATSRAAASARSSQKGIDSSR